ncbi:MAG: FkbM family methyltransferase [Deltaproteobacteria bacterium]|nr:FkbM family methyltransferase [Deltaproteobacteria bacterium]
MPGFLRPVLSSTARHCLRLIREPDFRTLCRLAFRLRHQPRYESFNIGLHGWNLSVPDKTSFIFSYEEIFVDRIYEFPGGKMPKILDLGANMGLSVLFFKRLFPDATITAVEADPKIFEHLVQNVHGNGFDDVILMNRAAWIKETMLKFEAEGADAGHICEEGADGVIETRAIDVAELLERESYDFVKMDIEGAEKAVIPHCKGALNRVSYIFVEYHSEVATPQGLGEVMKVLSDSGFRLHIHALRTSRNPFMQRLKWGRFDMQLNIFGWKRDTGR